MIADHRGDRPVLRERPFHCSHHRQRRWVGVVLSMGGQEMHRARMPAAQTKIVRSVAEVPHHSANAILMTIALDFTAPKRRPMPPRRGAVACIRRKSVDHSW